MPEPSRAELKYLVERQREEIKTLNEVARLLSATTDPQDIIRLVGAYLHQTYPLALCGVLVIDQRRLHLLPFANISQVDLATAIRAICAKANERLTPPLNEQSLERTVEQVSGGAAPWGQSAVGYLRSNYMAPLMTDDGKMLGILSVFSGKPEAFAKEEQHVIDIVASQLRAALRNAVLLDELRRANQLKNELLLVISHELRIPLTSIQEGVRLVADGSLGSLNADQQEFLKTVDANAERLQTLVEKVVTATQLVTAQLTYAFAQMSLPALLTELQAALRPAASAKRIHLEFAQPSGVAAITADSRQVTQALMHVIENAIQATDEGGTVTVDCSQTSGGVQVRVMDTGGGIPAEAMPTLFEQFRFIGGVDNRKTGGLGLGLFITKAIISAHGGTIQVDSQVGRGTKVTITLPKTPPDQPPKSGS